MKYSGNCLFQGGRNSLTSYLLTFFSYPSRGKKLFLSLILRPVGSSSNQFCVLPSPSFSQLCLPETTLLPVAYGSHSCVQCFRLSRVRPCSPSVALPLHPNPHSQTEPGAPGWVLLGFALPCLDRPQAVLLPAVCLTPPLPLDLRGLSSLS